MSDSTALVFADPAVALAVYTLEAKLKSYESIHGPNQIAAAAISSFKEVSSKLFQLGA